MSTTPYIPQAGSLPDRVAAYFRRLPDEELSVKDIVVKYQADQSNVHTQLKLAVDRGLLARDGQIYSAGEHINQGGETPAAVPPHLQSALISAPTRPGKPKGQHALINIAALKVDDDVPLVAWNRAGQSKWEPLFAKLVKTGQSIEVPRHVSAAIAAAMHKRHKDHPQRFRVAATSPETARIWRTA